MLFNDLDQSRELKHNINVILNCILFFEQRYLFIFILNVCSMKKLKEEMEGVVKELDDNNHILER